MNRWYLKLGNKLQVTPHSLKCTCNNGLRNVLSSVSEAQCMHEKKTLQCLNVCSWNNLYQGIPHIIAQCGLSNIGK